MLPKNRRTWSPEQKLQIILEGRTSGNRVMEVCRKYQISSSLFYTWEKQAREGALSALAAGVSTRRNPSEGQLRSEIEHLRRLVAELGMENLRLRKALKRRYSHQPES